VASPLDFIEEKHDGPEPRVLTKDVQNILKAKIRPGEDDGDSSVQNIAEKAGVSTRTVYRVLQPNPEKTTIGLDLADRLVLAADSHLAACHLVYPDGTITPYF
jgi:DNA invertase Pin-like site-specific DNA recombinase